MGQLAKAVSDRDKGKLPITSQVNPRERMMAITLRNGKELEEPSVREKSSKEKGKKVMVEKPKNDMEAKKEKVQNHELPSNQISEVKPYVPPIPFPQRLKDPTKKNNFMKHLQMFKKLQMNIPFIEVMQNF